MPKIEIKGVIVSNDDAWIYDWFEMEHTSPRSVADEIAGASGEPLEIAINSPGGDVYAGSEIYTALKEYQGEVTVKIVGVAASAASVAAMAGDRVLISPTAQIMIHNVSSGAWGDHRDHAHEADVLKGWNKSIANAYALKSGLSESELLAMMNKETWLTAQEAKEKGFVDEIMFDEGRRLAASASGLLPPEVIAKLRNELVKNKSASRGQTAVRSVSFYAKKLAL
ncbi:MAG TPA: head maturation protease, ClpP-related, partial [Brevibacillus sp.]|nr:head maturation protease, ClpP-related [Brevibacillus sp.]